LVAEFQAADRGFEDICVYAFPGGLPVEQAKARGQTAFTALVERAQRARALRARALRADIGVADLGLLVWSVVRATDRIRSSAPDAWRRHLAVLLDGLRAGSAHPLPGNPLDPELVQQAMTFVAVRGALTNWIAYTRAK
jgi:hypothetical protein